MSGSDDRQAAADLAVRMDLAGLVAAARRRELPEGTEPVLWCALETLACVAQDHPEIYAKLLDAIPAETIEGATRRLHRETQLVLLRAEVLRLKNARKEQT